MMRNEEIEIILLKNLLREITVKYDELIKKQNMILKKTFNDAIKDPLTGVYNRKFFCENGKKLLNIAKREDRKLLIIFIDLDNFKIINDMYGHAMGDEVLKSIAQILQEGFRSSDIISRLGGDEFVIAILLENEESEIIKIVERTRKTVEKKFEKISFSYGYSVFPEDGDTMELLIRVADERMYENKRKRKQ